MALLIDYLGLNNPLLQRQFSIHQMFNSTTGLYPPDASSTVLFPSVTARNASRYCQMSWGKGKQNHPLLRTTGRGCSHLPDSFSHLYHCFLHATLLLILETSSESLSQSSKARLIMLSTCILRIPGCLVITVRAFVI